ncbi:hypothetical protein PR202_gb12080 [Eleusine coracana subsp. coracana]|uniref:Uncharacterized protein n=1 Tax=Eleusine coracana subsp. coracana TaxID=191504 RepID=A0AAV5ELW0_ELECO|nr:hypothetical protein QOZ80_7BG0584670 [Eleusine coracana subsp. coracana]GJN24343.1 hypothetical protein PR202_gb12080 [Eleusine coracana subsp. coracana]
MLGFLCNLHNGTATSIIPAANTDDYFVSRFIPTTSPSSSCSPHLHRGARFVPKSPGQYQRSRGWRALDSHHGRVLLHSLPSKITREMVVWDPVTDKQFLLPELPSKTYPYWHGFNVAVLCDDHGCNHLDCHGGLFTVVFVGSLTQGGMFASVYSSETGAWSYMSSSMNIGLFGCVEGTPDVLVSNAVYFVLEEDPKILKCDLTTGGLSEIKDSHYYNDDARWFEDRVVELETLLPINALSMSPHVMGFADGAGLVILRADDGFFIVNPKSGQVKEIQEGGTEGGTIRKVVPYISFCTPQLGYSSA